MNRIERLYDQEFYMKLVLIIEMHLRYHPLQVNLAQSIYILMIIKHK